MTDKDITVSEILKGDEISVITAKRGIVGSVGGPFFAWKDARKVKGKITYVLHNREMPPGTVIRDSHGCIGELWEDGMWHTTDGAKKNLEWFDHPIVIWREVDEPVA
jgi:hypothetical protein